MLNRLENIIKTFPLLFIILNTVSYGHIQIYYSFFEIEILKYLDLTEIILLFFNNSIFLILIILIVTVLSYLISKKTFVENVPSSNIESKKLKRYFSFEKLILFAIIPILIILISRPNFGNIIFCIGYGFCFIIYFLFEKFLIGIIFSKFNRFNFFVISFNFVTFLLTNLYTITDFIETAYNIKNNHHEIKKICFTYDDKIIKTSRDILYIGETKEYLFLFDSKNKESLIFKNEKIENLKIKVN